MKKDIEVSIIVAAYNSETTILSCLNSIQIQDYPIKEVLVIDNYSSDKTVEIVEQFKNQNNNFPLHIIKQPQTYRVSTSFNLGAKLSKGNYLIDMHSDCVLPTKSELKKLIDPFINDPTIALSAPLVIMPKKIWEKYSFWQKYLFSYQVDVKTPSGNGQFECIRKDVFLKIGGYDEKNFGGKEVIGGEDADFHIRLRKVGKVVVSDALVLHVHYTGENFSFSNLLKHKKVNARSYGRFIKTQGTSLSFSSFTIFLIKPFLAITPFIPIRHYIGLVVLSVYSLYYSRKMFFDLRSLTNPRIMLIPFLNIFFVYYDLFWITQAFIFSKKKV